LKLLRRGTSAVAILVSRRVSPPTPFLKIGCENVGFLAYFSLNLHGHDGLFHVLK
jgi:hypothetical protein